MLLLQRAGLKTYLYATCWPVAVPLLSCVQHPAPVPAPGLNSTLTARNSNIRNACWLWIHGHCCLCCLLCFRIVHSTTVATTSAAVSLRAWGGRNAPHGRRDSERQLTGEYSGISHQSCHTSSTATHVPHEQLSPRIVAVRSLWQQQHITRGCCARFQV